MRIKKTLTGKWILRDIREKNERVELEKKLL
jgi:hypothetical protein